MSLVEIKNNDVSKRNLNMLEFTGQLSEKTRKCYLTDICEFFGVVEPSQITLDMVKKVNVIIANNYVEELIERGLAPSTINRKLQALAKFYSFLCQKRIGIMEYNPFSTEEGCRRISFDKTYSNTRCLTKDEISKLIQTVKSDNTIEGIRNSIIILLLYSCGMRRSEICKLKIKNVRYTDGHYVLKFIGKRGKERMVEINDTIKILIDKYLEMRNLDYEDEEKPLFTSHSTNRNFKGHLSGEAIRLIVKKIAEKAGLKDVNSISPHCLRHSFVTEAIRRWGVGVAQKLAGHADISTTRIYDHTNDVLDKKASSVLLRDLGV